MGEKIYISLLAAIFRMIWVAVVLGFDFLTLAISFADTLIITLLAVIIVKWFYKTTQDEKEIVNF